MRIVGLTGGIACGKSTVALFLKEDERVVIIDLDNIARVVVEPGKRAYNAIVSIFGKEILLEDGTLDREQLGDVVFKDRKSLKTLNKIMFWPMAIELWKRIILNFIKGTNILVLDAPLLYETGLNRITHLDTVVYCPFETQMKRLKERDKCTEEEGKRKIDAQIPLDKKVNRADFIIDNSGNLDNTKKEVNNLLIQVMKQSTLLTREIILVSVMTFSVLVVYVLVQWYV